MNLKIKNEKGITLVALVITIVIMVILTNILVYNAKDEVTIKALTNLYNDISLLRESVSAYYNEYGKIPAEIKYPDTNIKSRLTNVLSETNDIGDFYVIDLEAMQGITLNYGKDYKSVKKDIYHAGDYLDLYVINENSHNIFYIKGIDIKENNETKTYYTDYIEPDETSIDLRYIDGVLIPEGYYYIGKIKVDAENENIVISSNKEKQTVDTNNENQYIWTKQVSELEKIPDSVNLDNNQKEYQFIKSVNTYKGYFKNSKGKVQYIVIDEEKWSDAYTKELEYKDRNGDVITIPQGFKISMASTMNTVENGFVVKDSNDNEWVWIVVPKSIFSTAENNTDYDNIKEDLIKYAKDYREGKSGQGCSWTDEWYEGCGIEAKDGKTGAEIYTEMYNKMLSSVYTNGGFWISRYEAGIAGTNTDTTSETISAERNSYSAITSDSPKAVSQANRIPYNYVYCSDAQKLASAMSTDSTKTSSLLFGIQWDLVCKYLEVNAFNGTSSFLNSDSATWGNYKNSSITLKANSRYRTSTESSSGKWSLYNVNGSFVTLTGTVYKTNSEASGLLTTGASEDAKKMNIYDFAGNENEFTLEHATTDVDYPCPCAYRGGNYGYNGSTGPASYRDYSPKNHSNCNLGFRSTLY